MKSFREQFIECNKNGTCKKIEITPYSPCELLLCTKYMEQCNSGLCKIDRMTLEEKYEEFKKGD
jgi:hypothetical protein